MRKKVLLSLLILIIAASVLTACNKDKDKNPAVTYGDIYVQHSGIVRKADYDHDRSFVLPEGVIPYYIKKESLFDETKEYAAAYDKENGVLKVRKDILGENGKVASSRYGFVSLKTKKLIGSGAVYSADFFVENGFIGAYNADTNKYELFRNDGTRLNVPVSADSKKTSEMFMTLSEDYYALSDGNDSWQIYAANNSASPVAGGKKFSTDYFDEQAQKTYDVSYIVADNYIIATRMIKATLGSKVAVVDVVAYDLASGNEITSMFKGVGAYSSGAIRAAYYLGGGKFYCYERTSSTKDDGYQYKELTNPEEEEIDKRYTYHKIMVWTYDMATGKKTLVIPDRIFSVIVNKYYKQSVKGDIREYINNGYSWVSVALTRDADRVATEDQQYVIDSNLNIYVSLSDKSGSATRYDEGSNDYRYVKLTFVDGYGFDEDSTGDLIIYDKQGNTVLRKEGTYSKVFYNNGIVTAVKEVADGSKYVKYVVAYKLDGTVVFDETRKYSDIVGSTYYNDRLAFVGKYAMVKIGTTYLLVDNTGRDVDPSVSDMYTTKEGAFFFNGVYVTQDKKTSKFGLKNYDGDVIFENKFKEVIIDAKRFGDVIFYAKDENGVWNVYFI